MLRYLLIIIAIGCFTSTLVAEEIKKLSQQETNKVVDDIFSKAQNIHSLETDIITIKNGGVVKDEQKVYEYLRLEAPSRMYLQNRGNSEKKLPVEQCNLIVIDGRNIWEVEAKNRGEKYRSVSRREFKPDTTNMQGKGLGAFIGLFLLGKEVYSASGLQQDFNITCTEEKIPNSNNITLHLVLEPKQGGDVIELWLLPEQALPWKVKTVSKKEIKFPPPKPGQPVRYKIEETIRVLRNVKTNVTGLNNFTAESFLLPIANDMKIRDEKNNQEITLNQAREELKIVKEEYIREHNK